MSIIQEITTRHYIPKVFILDPSGANRILISSRSSSLQAIYLRRISHATPAAADLLSLTAQKRSLAFLVEAAVIKESQEGRVPILPSRPHR